MITQLTDEQIIKKLKIKPTDKVLDIGGSARQHNVIRVDTLVDLFHPEELIEYGSKLKAKNFVKVDITRDRLPFKDKQFDVCVCTHTLEDLYNPFLAIEEMSRVAKRGYIATPNRGWESTFRPLDMSNWRLGPVREPGLAHHHWMFEVIGKKWLITPKIYPLLYTPKLQVTAWTGPQEARYFWQDKIEYQLFNSVSFADAIEDYQTFINRNKDKITLGRAAVFLDNPLQMAKEIAKLILKPKARPHS